MDTILIAAAYIFAGDSKYRLSSKKKKGQAPTLSFTYNQASDLAFLHLDGEFTYSRTGYYPESNSLELYLDPKSAWMLCGVLKNIVVHTQHPGESPEETPRRHTPESPMPEIIEEYTVQSKAITISHPMNLYFSPRTMDGFTTYVALTLPPTVGDKEPNPYFRLKFWLTERSVPELNLLQRRFRERYDTRTQPMHVTFSFGGAELSLLQRQLEVLGVRYCDL